MNNEIRWKSMLVGGIAVLVLAFGTAAVYPQVSQAVDGTSAAPAQQRGSRVNVDHDALLAEALGISTEDLQAAYNEAMDAALAQAVEADLLTQTQADAMRERLGDAPGTYSFRGFGFGHFGRMGGSPIDFEALLAEALGITVDELQAAHETAQSAAVDQMVEEGRLTQEQADIAEAWRAFQNYQREQQPSFEQLVQQAVEAGAITQEQADLILSNQQMGPGRLGHGMMGPGMRGSWQDGPGFPQGPGMDGRRGRGDGDGFRGFPFGNDDRQDDSSQSQSNLGQLLPAANL